MKKTLFMCLALVLTAGYLSAQTCERDSSLLQTGGIISPPAYSDSFPVIATAPVCINEPYIESVTLNVPEQFVFNNIPASIDSITIATTGAITGLPVGLNYTCDPPNCHFVKNSLGCVLLQGTATSANAQGQYELFIKLKIFTPILPFPIDIDFPGTLASDQHYYLLVKPTGECTNVGTDNLSGQLSRLSANPNPFGQTTTISLESQVRDRFQFEVFNIMGQKIYQEAIQVETGSNQFTFDAGDIPNGTYYFSLSNATGRTAQAFVIQR